MSAARKAPKIDEKEVATLCAEIVQRIKTQEDPVSLNAFRSLVRKNVPFFMRSYFAAFLLKRLFDAVPSRGRADQGERKRRPEPAPESRKEPRAEPKPEPKPERSALPEPPRRTLPEAEAATLFIGVGRNRRAYARDLYAFLVGGDGCDPEDFGELRVLDNFSFVQVRKEAADAVIEKLNGKEFRGRSVPVSYAKPRKEDSRAEPAPAEAPQEELPPEETSPEETPPEESSPEQTS